MTDSNNYLTVGSSWGLKYTLRIAKSPKFLRSLPPAVNFFTLCQTTIEDLDLLHEDLEQIDDMDLKRWTYKWKIGNDCYSNEEVQQEDWKESPD
ncbi:hypothetical protein Tco_1110089 [Tanacetum coccineum]|uniref:SKP1 component dimerisation domain-containing protein n=1 Tax=Tanacetum coccineum TaxID=301880 RepID=A0ABQ5IIZ8_9ASTR